MHPRLLVISRHRPAAHGPAREALNTALTAASFDMPVSILWLDDGVCQLFADTAADTGAFPRMLMQLGLFERVQLYSDAGALQARRLAGSTPLLPAQPLAEAGLRELLQHHSHVIGY